jgi:hypothetical protein
LLALVLVVCAALACHRKVEPFDPNERPQQPDLAKIFPEGAERAMGTPAQMPPSPEEMMGSGPRGGAADTESAGPPIRGTIALASGASVPPGATLFVIARSGQAGPPTAVLKLPAPSFPYAFAIGPENRMIAAMPWQGPLVVSARIDLDGNAMTRDAGGLEGRAEQPASPGDAGVAITLEPSS